MTCDRNNPIKGYGLAFLLLFCLLTIVWKKIKILYLAERGKHYVFLNDDASSNASVLHNIFNLTLHNSAPKFTLLLFWFLVSFGSEVAILKEMNDDN